VGYAAFAYCDNLASVEMAYGVTQIDGYAFVNCPNLTSFAIPASLTSIGDGAFSGCTNFEEIVLGENSNDFVVESGVLFNKDMTKIIQFPSGKVGAYTVPSSVTDIGEGAFSHSKGLTSVIMPLSVASIGDSAFYSCTSLSAVTMSDNVTEIGDIPFTNCLKLEEITVIQTKADSNDDFYYSHRRVLSDFKLVFKQE
jgi:hypothetical protein